MSAELALEEVLLVISAVVLVVAAPWLGRLRERLERNRRPGAGGDRRGQPGVRSRAE